MERGNWKDSLDGGLNVSKEFGRLNAKAEDTLDGIDALEDRLGSIEAEVHENNIMLRQLIAYVRFVLKRQGNEEGKDFGRNVVANLTSEIIDGIKGAIRNG